MLKKLFVLASVTTLTGSIAAAGAACSPTEEATSSADAGRDAAKDVEPPPKRDADPPPVDKTCWSDDPIATPKVDYKPARVEDGACTEKVFSVIDDFIGANDDATWNDLKDEISAKESSACASCVFGDINASTWAPIVGPGDGTNQVNFGGCIEVASGSAECAQAFVAWNACLDEACTCTAESPTECSNAVQTTACKAASDVLVEACGNGVNAYIEACNKKGDGPIVGAIRKQCIGTDAGDAGHD